MSVWTDLLLGTLKPGGCGCDTTGKKYEEDRKKGNKIPTGGGGGIKTAIFRPKQFDEFVAGDENAYNTSLECVNMTRDEVIQTLMSGQPVDYIIIRYGDSGSGLIVSRPAEPKIEWYPAKDELHIGDVGYWFTNGAIDYPAE